MVARKGQGDERDLRKDHGPHHQDEAGAVEARVGPVAPVDPGALEEKIFPAFAHDEKHGSCQGEKWDIRQRPVAEKTGIPVLRCERADVDDARGRRHVTRSLWICSGDSYQYCLCTKLKMLGTMWVHHGLASEGAEGVEQ